MNDIKNKEFIKSFMVLASGSVVAQLITIIISPISTRLFSSSELGEYTLLLSIVNIFGPILSLRYDYMIIPEKQEQKVYCLVKLCIILGILTSTLVSIGYVIFLIITSQNISLLFTILLFILLLLNSLINILTAYNNRNKEYKIMSSTYVVRTIMQNTFLVVFGFLRLGSIGLVLSQTIGTFFGIKKQSESISKKYHDIKRISKKDLLTSAKIYKKQFTMATPAAFLNSFSYNSINLIISSLFSNTILGFYSISYRVLGMPLTLISNNVSKVYFETASKEFNEFGKFNDTFKRIIKYLLPISLLMVFVLVGFSPWLFSIVFGEEWREAGVFVQILAPMFSIKLISSTLGPSIWITQKQKYDMIFQVLLILVVVICSIFTLLFNFNIYFFLILYSFLTSIVYLYSIYVHYQLSKGNI